MMSIDTTLSLLKEGIEIKHRMEKDKQRLAMINNLLVNRAEFTGSTAHIFAGDIHAKIVRRVNMKWDQALLGEARSKMGDEKFFKVFSWEYKPASSKALKGFLDYGDAGSVAMVRHACTETYSAPSVTYEIIE